MLRDADELSMGPGFERRGASEHVVADGEPADRCPDCFDLSRQLCAQDPLPGSPQAEDQADQERLTRPNAAVGTGHRRPVTLHEHLVIAGDGPLDVFEPLNLRRPVPVVDDRFHWSPLVCSDETVRTTLPIFCCVSTYLVASITSSSG